VQQALGTFCGERRPPDDITMVVIRLEAIQP
jgi:hypothetical protein